ncbi:MAG TPA: RNA methyltransferase, partial [Kofleriaceae bacterium]|nr:RNA methyltransferase [Kofleriaceae bacterium]
LAAIAKACEPAEQGAARAEPVDVLGQSLDPLAKVERALARVDDVIGGIEGEAGPLTPARTLEQVAATVADAEATLAEIESTLPASTTTPSTTDRADGPATTTPSTTARAGQPATTTPSTTEGAPRPHRVLLSPSGTPLTQARVRELATLGHLVLVCGRYEGIDQRVIDLAIDEELSIGDYVLSGGELGALVIIDAVARLVPGVLGEPTSADDESFSAGLLEYPQYTRPQELSEDAIPPPLRDRTASPVPAVLQSGNHAAIAAWRRQQSMQRTAARRPDLWRQFRPTKADAKLFPPLRARTHVALVHHPVVDRTGAIVTTSLTNFDIHDLARSSMTYGLAGYHIVTPVASQREKAEHIASMWMASEQGEHRAAALRLIHTAESIEVVIAALTAEHGQPPLVVATSARAESFPEAARRTSSELVAEASLAPAPMLLLLGTGWGLADSLIPSVSRVLAPIEGGSPWNHLSVRSAGAIILDRLFGLPA